MSAKFEGDEPKVTPAGVEAELLSLARDITGRNSKIALASDSKSGLIELRKNGTVVTLLGKDEGGFQFDVVSTNRNGEVTFAHRFQSGPEEVVDRDVTLHFARTALGALDNLDAALLELKALADSSPQVHSLVKLPTQTEFTPDLYADLTALWWKVHSDTHPIDVTVTGAHTRLRVLTEAGLNTFRDKLPNAVVVFMDKDNAGILNDVGLSCINDYLFEQEHKIFQACFDTECDVHVRFAGDEFLFVTSNDERGLASIKNALHAADELRRKILIDKDFPEELRKILDENRIDDASERIEQAHKLGCFRKLMAGISSQYSAETKDRRSMNPEHFGDWILGQLGEDLKQEWVSFLRLSKTTGTISIASIAEQIGLDKEVVAHSLQAFVADWGIDRLKEPATPSSISDSLMSAMRVASEHAAVMGTSCAVSALPPKYTTRDFFMKIGEAEFKIYAAKRGEEFDPLDPNYRYGTKDIILRKAEKDELSKHAALVSEYDHITGMLERDDAALTALDKLQLQAEAFRLVCADPGSDMLRLSQIGDFKAREVLPIGDEGFVTAFKFHIKGVGGFNKAKGMNATDAIVAAVAKRMEDQFPELTCMVRAEGGTGVVYLKGDIKLGEDVRQRQEATLTQVVKDNIDGFVELAFYEKQAYRMFATASRRYPAFRDKQSEPEELGSVSIHRAAKQIDGNERIKNIHKKLFG